MDANGAKFWLLTGPEHLSPADDPDRVAWEGGVLRLADQRDPPSLDEGDPSARIEEVPGATDGYDSFSVIDDGGPARVLVQHPELAEGEIFTDPSTGGITSICIGDDGLVTVIASDTVHLRDSRSFGDAVEEWQTQDLSALGTITPWRATPRVGGGAWVIDRDQGQLLSWTGFLLRDRPLQQIRPDVFRPSPEDPQTVRWRLHHTGFGGDTVVALATSPAGRVAVLTHRAADTARIHLFDTSGALVRTFALAGLSRPWSLSWADDGRVALLAEDGLSTVSEAFTYPVDTDDPLVSPSGHRFPLRRHTGEGFVVHPDQQPWYPATDGLRRLVALSLPHRSTLGAATGVPLDSRSADTCWHRLYLEGRVPEGTGIRILLATSADGNAPTDASAWYAHDFGSVTRLSEGSPVALDDGTAGVISEPLGDGLVRVRTFEGTDEEVDEDSLTPRTRPPRASWIPAASELPGHPGLLSCNREPDLAGLFGVLIQRSGHPGSRLVGRFLHVRLVLHGDGRGSPEVVGLRAWGSRFSYVREYLPELYHEDPLLDGTSELGSTSGADYLERFVSLFEGLLTPIEDNIASAWRLTHPYGVPAEGLDWLASWLGIVFDSELPDRARRRLLAAAPELGAWRGTRRALELALEIITDGGISRGEVVVLEEWRLRRTWATILGADLADEEDPMLGGLTVSGNSIVGDTLLLGDEQEREFLALFAPELLELKRANNWRELVRAWLDGHSVADFFERTAHRASVLVLDELDPATMALVRSTSEELTPAHVTTRVLQSSRAFVASLSALVGIDTHLTPQPVPQGVRLGRTRLGRTDRLQRPSALHPDLQGGAS